MEKPKHKLEDFVFDFDSEQEPGSKRQSSKQIERNLILAASVFNGQHQQDIDGDSSEQRTIRDGNSEGGRPAGAIP